MMGTSATLRAVSLHGLGERCVVCLLKILLLEAHEARGTQEVRVVASSNLHTSRFAVRTSTCRLSLPRHLALRRAVMRRIGR